MGNFLKNNTDPINFVHIRITEKPNIFIKDDHICIEQCENKPCTYYCPSRVFYWEDNEIKVDYARCIECGSCPWGCPYKNINWAFPPGGYGVKYEV